MNQFIAPILGGVCIGLSSVLMMLLLGRITGLSGILWGWISHFREFSWRMFFIVRLILGSLIVHYGFDFPRPDPSDAGWLLMILGGFLVGFGTSLGSGCTSGHGVCGIGRLSLRSLVATLTFMGSCFLTVTVMRHVLTVGSGS